MMMNIQKTDNFKRLHDELEYLHDKEISIRNNLLYDFYNGKLKPIPKSEIICDFLGRRLIWDNSLVDKIYEQFIKTVNDNTIPIEDFITILSLIYKVTKDDTSNNLIIKRRYCERVNIELELKHWLNKYPQLDMTIDEYYKKYSTRDEWPDIEGVCYRDVSFDEFKVILDEYSNHPKYQIY